MQGRFLPWAGCTISDLKLTCSSAQGECPPARAPVESAQAEPTEKLLSASNKSSRIHAIIFFSRSLCIIRNRDTLNISIQKNLHNNHMSSFACCRQANKQNNPGLGLRVPYSWTILLPSASCCNLPIADTSQLKPRSGLNSAGIYFSDELWIDRFTKQRWTGLLTCVILLSLTATLCPRLYSITE